MGAVDAILASAVGEIIALASAIGATVALANSVPTSCGLARGKSYRARTHRTLVRSGGLVSLALVICQKTLLRGRLLGGLVPVSQLRAARAIRTVWLV